MAASVSPYLAGKCQQTSKYKYSFADVYDELEHSRPVYMLQRFLQSTKLTII